MKKTKLRVELIVWDDAWGGYPLPVEPEDIARNGKRLVSVGVFVYEDAHEVVLARETGAPYGDSRVRDVFGIPKKMIRSRRVLWRGEL